MEAVSMPEMRRADRGSVEKPRPTIRRFTAEEDNQIIDSVRRGTTVKSIGHRLDRAKSSLCWRIDYLRRHGRLEERVRVTEITLKIRLSGELHERLSAQATSRGKTVSGHLRWILRAYVEGQK